MSDEPAITGQADPDGRELSLERGAGLAAMKDRSPSIAPPPRLAPTTPTELTPDSSGEPVTTETQSPGEQSPPEAERKTRRRSTRSAARSTTSGRSSGDDLIGRQKGQLRHITVRIPIGLRRRLDSEAAAAGQSLGEVAMDQVRAHHKDLRSEARTPVDDGFAAPRRKRKRSADGTKQQTGLFVTPEEARALQDLADEVMMSVSLTVEECLRRSWPDSASDD